MKNIAKKIKSKLKNSKGFTIVELLFSVIILMLSTSVIIQCFNLGVGNVVKETRASEAQLLCSALASSLQNELTYARDIEIESGKLKTYFSSSRRMGEGSRIVVDSNGEIIITNALNETYPLVTKTNYTATNRAAVKSSSTYFLKAYLDGNAIQWSNTDQVFTVTLWVDDASKGALTAAQAKTQALAYTQFRVKPLTVVNN